MPIRPGGAMFSFDVLAGDDRTLLRAMDSGRILENGHASRPLRRKRKPKASKKNKKMLENTASEDLNPPTVLGDEKPSSAENGHYQDQIGLGVLENRPPVEIVCESTVVEAECESSRVSGVSYPELRQRNVNGSVAEEPGEEATSGRESSAGQWTPESNGGVAELEMAKSLDWNQVMAQDPNLLGEVSVILLAPPHVRRRHYLSSTLKAQPRAHLSQTPGGVRDRLPGQIGVLSGRSEC